MGTTVNGKYYEVERGWKAEQPPNQWQRGSSTHRQRCLIKSSVLWISPMSLTSWSCLSPMIWSGLGWRLMR